MLTSIDEYVEQYVRIQQEGPDADDRNIAATIRESGIRDGERLIRENVLQPRGKPAAEDAVLKECGAPVWSIISYLHAFGGDMSLIASYFETTLESVMAAIFHYMAHQAAIDQRIKSNDLIFETS